MRKDESAARGQTIRTEGGVDRSSDKRGMDEAIMGRAMKGGPTDLSSTLSGAGSYNDKGSAKK
jgi:hypothetical protein